MFNCNFKYSIFCQRRTSLNEYFIIYVQKSDIVKSAFWIRHLFLKNQLISGNKNFAFLFPIFYKKGWVDFFRWKNQHFLIRDKSIILCKIIGIIRWKIPLCFNAATLRCDFCFYTHYLIFTPYYAKNLPFHNGKTYTEWNVSTFFCNIIHAGQKKTGV